MKSFHKATVLSSADAAEAGVSGEASKGLTPKIFRSAAKIQKVSYTLDADDFFAAL